MVREWVFIILVKVEDGRLPTQNIWHCRIGRNALCYRKCRGAADTPLIVNVRYAAFAAIQKLVGSTQNRPVTFTTHRKNRQVDGQNQGHKWPQKCHETEEPKNVRLLKRAFRLFG